MNTKKIDRFIDNYPWCWGLIMICICAVTSIPAAMLGIWLGRML